MRLSPGEEAFVYLINPTPFGGRVLPIVITTGNNQNLVIACALIDFTTLEMKSKIFSYEFNDSSMINKTFEYPGEVCSFYMRSNMYILLEENYKDLLKPWDSFKFDEIDIHKILVFMSCEKCKPLLLKLKYLAETINIDLGKTIENYIGDDAGSLNYYWTVREIKLKDR